MTSDKQVCVYEKCKPFMKNDGASEFVIPPQLVQADVGRTLFLGERGGSRGGLRGGTPESCSYKGWDKG